MGRCLLPLLVVTLVIRVYHQFCLRHLYLEPVLLTGKTAIVTGASDGIGKETARVLASWGCVYTSALW